MHPFTLPRGRPEVVYLAAQDVWRDLALAVHRRSLPQQQPLDGQQRMPRLVVAARGIGEPITGPGDGFYNRGVEMATGIGEMIDAFAEAAFEVRFGLLDFSGGPSRRFDRQRYVRARVRTDDEAPAPHVRQHVPGHRQRYVVEAVADAEFETRHQP